MSGRWQTLAIAFVVAAIAFLTFSKTLGHDFLNWDDDVYVYQNPAIQSLTPRNIAWLFSHFYYYAYIPVPLLSHGIDIALWGMNPRGHHLTNVLLHSANAAWVFILGLPLLGAGRASAPRRGQDSARAPQNRSSALVGMTAAAVLFAVHPLRAESVSWVSDRKDLLCAFFLLPAILAYIEYSSARGTPRARRWVLTTFVLFLLAVLSKSIAVTFPVLLLLLDRLLLTREARKPSHRALALEKVPFFVVSLTLAILSFANSPDGKKAYAVAHLTGVEALLFPFYSLSFSLYKTLLPVHLAPIYPRVGLELLIAGLAIVLTITGASVLCARRGTKAPLLAWLAYLVLLVPNVAGLSSGMQPVADRYSYLSTGSLFVLLAAAIAVVWKGERRRHLAVMAGVGALTILSVGLTVSQAARWKTSASLWEYVVEKFPARPDYSDAYLNLGVAYAQERRPQRAREILEKAVEIDPTNAEASYNLGIISYAEGDRQEAYKFFLRATEVDPHHAKAFYNLAIVADQLGRGEQALGAMIRAARLGFKDAQAALASRKIPW